MIQSNPGVQHPLLISNEQTKRGKARQFQIGGLVETSSNSSANTDNQSPQLDNVLPKDRVTAAGLPIAVNPHHVSSDNNSSAKSNRNAGSESE